MTYEEWLALPEEHESARGYHFLYLYNENKWSWYLRYVRGYRPITTKPALIEGGVIHSAIECYLRFGDLEQAIVTARTLLEQKQDKYTNMDAYKEALSFIPKMIVNWANKWAIVDKQFYTTIAIEETFDVELVEGSGITMTIRPDWIVRDSRDGRVYILDHKSTHYSIPNAAEAVFGQDQSTAYIWGVKKSMPKLADEIVGVIPDVLYQRGNVYDSQRPGVVVRSEIELFEFEQEAIGLLAELAAKVCKLDKYPPHFLFPRNGKDETYFSGGDYYDIYRMELPENPDECPRGYIIDPSAKTAINYLKEVAEKLRG